MWDRARERERERQRERERERREYNTIIWSGRKQTLHKKYRHIKHHRIIQQTDNALSCDIYSVMACSSGKKVKFVCNIKTLSSCKNFEQNMNLALCNKLEQGIQRLCFPASYFWLQRAACSITKNACMYLYRKTIHRTTKSLPQENLFLKNKWRRSFRTPTRKLQ